MNSSYFIFFSFLKVSNVSHKMRHLTGIKSPFLTLGSYHNHWNYEKNSCYFIISLLNMCNLHFWKSCIFQSVSRKWPYLTRKGIFLGSSILSLSFLKISWFYDTNYSNYIKSSKNALWSNVTQFLTVLLFLNLELNVFIKVEL